MQIYYNQLDKHLQGNLKYIYIITGDEIYQEENCVQKIIKKGSASEEFLNHAFKNLSLLLQPFVPHLSEAMWKELGLKNLAISQAWPKHSGTKRKQTAILLLVTALLGASFVGMQAFEWTKLIMEGVRPWENPFGAHQFGSVFFMVTGFHGFHVSIGVIFLFINVRKVWRGDYDTGRRGFFTWQKGRYEIVETLGLYWHFVDLVWVFIFAFFYLW